MQQSAFEHAALIWTRPANTIRAGGMSMAATEAGYMSAPDNAQNCFRTPRAHGAVIHVAQIACLPRFPFPRTDLSHGLCDRDAERGVAVQNGDTDLKLRDLSVEVPRHEALPQQFHTVHLRFDAASAVVSAPSSPDRSAEAFRRA